MSNRAPTADGEEGPLQFWLLGGLRATRDGVALDLGRPKQRLVLTLLLLEAGRVLPAERLAQLLWGQDGPKERASLQAYLSNLRRILEPDRATTSASTVIVRRAPGYLLAVDR
ncbi:MAG: AfsR/SARP family transcriptional regulator [Acidimicrobiales bacterium]